MDHLVGSKTKKMGWAWIFEEPNLLGGFRYEKRKTKGTGQGLASQKYP